MTKNALYTVGSVIDVIFITEPEPIVFRNPENKMLGENELSSTAISVEGPDHVPFILKYPFPGSVEVSVLSLYLQIASPPSTPFDPLEPEVPLEPMPEDPLEPEVPSVPEIPEDPLDPEIPLVPEVPCVPIPEDPLEPEEPAAPLEPEEPEVPRVPELPLDPEVPFVPDPPLVPAAPSITVMLPR